MRQSDVQSEQVKKVMRQSDVQSEKSDGRQSDEQSELTKWITPSAMPPKDPPIILLGDRIKVDKRALGKRKASSRP